MNTAKTPPLLPGASSTQTKAILGAMRAVAETGGAATKARIPIRVLSNNFSAKS